MKTTFRKSPQKTGHAKQQPHEKPTDFMQVIYHQSGIAYSLLATNFKKKLIY